MKLSSLFALSLLATIGIPTAKAIEVTPQHVTVHLSESITNQDRAAQHGLKDNYHAPEGQMFLSVTMQLIASDWEEDGPSSIECRKEAITLKVGDQTLPVIGECRMANSYYFNGQNIRLSRPNSDEESSKYAGPTFLVPADFQTGVLTLGELTTLEVSANDATPVGTATGDTTFTVTETALVDELTGRWSINQALGDRTIQPVNRKLLVATVNITAAENISSNFVSIASGDLSVATGADGSGSLATCSGTINHLNLADLGGSTSTSVAPGHTGKMTLFFAVPNDHLQFALLYRGEPVATFPAE